MVEQVLRQADMKVQEMDAIAIAEGPGSFTGLRIGAATVKGLGLAIQKPIVPVSTLYGLAYNVQGDKHIICPIMDARRGQVYTALYEYCGEVLCEITPPKATSIDELLESFGPEDQVMFVGDGIAVYKEIIDIRLGEAAHFAPPHIRLQNASSLAVIAAERYLVGDYVSAMDFKPVYLRMSQAEREKLEAKTNG